MASILTKAQQATLAIPTLPKSDDIQKSINLAHQSHGDNISPDIAVRESALLQYEMKNRGYCLSKEELQTALLNGTFGKYGEVYRVCPTEMIVWVSEFIQEKARQAEEARKAAAAVVTKEKAEEIKAEENRKAREHDAYMKDLVNKAFFEYEKTTQLPMWTEITTKLVFRYLQRHGWIKQGIESDFTPAAVVRLKLDPTDPTRGAQAAVRKADSANNTLRMRETIKREREEIRAAFDAAILRREQKRAETA